MRRGWTISRSSRLWCVPTQARRSTVERGLLLRLEPVQVAHAHEVRARVRLLDARVGKVLQTHRHLVFAAFAEAATQAQDFGELKAGSEQALRRAVDMVHHRAADAGIGE